MATTMEANEVNSLVQVQFGREGKGEISSQFHLRLVQQTVCWKPIGQACIRPGDLETLSGVT